MTACRKTENSSQLASPDGKVVFELLQSPAGTLSYTISGDGEILLEQSDLGLVSDTIDLSHGLAVKSTSPVKAATTSYRLLTGKRLLNNAVYQERTYKLTNPFGFNLDLEVRAFNDGIAFRYVLPDVSVEPIHVIAETTSFNLPQPGKAWMHPYDQVSKWTPAYETYYMDSLAIGDAAPGDKNGWAFPVLFEVNGHWILISEAGHDGTYPAMHLDVDPATGNYSMRLPEADEAYNKYPATGQEHTPWILPWRVLVIGSSLATIVESNLITHVTEPGKIADTSWIKPGRASWSWWSDNDSPKDYTKLKRFVDFASEMGWEYSLVDANWDEMQGGSLEKLAAYSATKNVGLLVWYNSGGEHNIVTEKPRDLMWDRNIRRAEFKKLHDWGIKGVKVDFFQSDKPALIRQYIDILEDAAEFGILVNFHGCTIPKGWRRTYPNLVTMESIRGSESYIFAEEYPGMAPVHLNIATYTRNVIGPMDYTPVGLSELKYPHLTSYAFELAQGVIFESGIQHLSDDPDAYRALPEFALEYLKQLPVAWDETKFIAGYPGDYTIIARRSGEDWYLAGLNGRDNRKELELDMNFLPDSVGKIKLITSGSSHKQLQQSTVQLSQDKKLRLSMEALDGFVARFTLE